MYCEPTQWNGILEPWNSISNLAFFYSSYQIFKLNQKKPKSISLYFSICILMIGIGSFFWHFYPNRITLAMDSIPILWFVISFLFLYTRLQSKNLTHHIILFICFFIFVFVCIYLGKHPLFEPISKFVSFGYLSAILYLFFIQTYNIIYARFLIKKSLLIALLFLISLTFRSLDLYICNEFPIGTHWIWHGINALVLYKMSTLLIFSD